MINGFIYLCAYRDVPEAYIAKGRLEYVGIECLMRDENLIQVNWLYSNAIGGVKLYVRNEDYLKSVEELGLNSVPTTQKTTQSKPFWKEILSLITVGLSWPKKVERGTQ